MTRLIPFPQGVSTPPMMVGWESHGVRGSRLAHGRGRLGSQTHELCDSGQQLGISVLGPLL